MAKKPVKEAGTALIFATVFFVLTTIAFGVMWYMEFSDKETNKAAVESAKKDTTAARGELADAKLDAQTYRLFIGIGDDDDTKAATAWADKDKKRVGETLKKINQIVVDKVAKGSELPKELALWQATEAGVPGDLPKAPDGTSASPLSVIGTLATQRDAAQAKEEKTSAQYTAAVGTMQAAVTALDKIKQDFLDKAKELPADFSTKLAAEITKFEDRKKKFAETEANSRNEINALNDQKSALELNTKKLKTQIEALQEQVTTAVVRAQKDNKTDAFVSDEPQGKVLRRLPDDVIEIDLGSDALVRPGLTFTVLPHDFQVKGKQSRMRAVRVADERGQYKNVERFVEKATIEVIEVIGPKLSRCRITQEADKIRDGAAPGDLLYNSVWRKGTADHIALIGIFDTNGDGTDDIEGVIRDLTRMGIPVDAYYDLKQRKWVGQITEQTRYVVEGWYPAQGAMDPNRDEKTKMLGEMSAAIKIAKDRGVATVNFRDFFPRMGYRVKLDINIDRLNQATAPYLNKVATPDPPPPGN